MKATTAHWPAEPLRTHPAPDPPTPTPTTTALAVREPIAYVFELSRFGVLVGGGVVIAPSSTAAKRTAELALAGGADVRIVEPTGPPSKPQKSTA
ncbi:MAG: hypothetical protein JHC98_03765 [Thermoleophilaceae bacterium]|nr:hypothetical protein [Thermoleophilaceae bacterium]